MTTNAMTTTTTQTAPAPAPTVGLGDLRAMAESIARSGLFPAAKSADAAMALLLLAQAEGLHPMQAMRRYHVIEGQPTMRADAMLASFQAAGGRVAWRRTDEQECSAEFSAPGSSSLTVAWTMADARRAGLGGKTNWARYPRQMLRARVISEGVRATMPGVVCGLYTPEEAADFGRPAVVDATPEPARLAAVPATPAEQLPEWMEPAPPAAGPAAIGQEGAARLTAWLMEAMPAGEGGRREQAKRWGDMIEGAIGRRPKSASALADLTQAEADAVKSAIVARAEAAPEEVARE